MSRGTGAVLRADRDWPMTAAQGKTMSNKKVPNMESRPVEKSPKYGEPSHCHLTIPLRINLLGDSTPQRQRCRGSDFFQTRYSFEFILMIDLHLVNLKRTSPAPGRDQ